MADPPLTFDSPWPLAAAALLAVAAIVVA
ncbi:MAG: hypothetical protein JWO31_2968, partial [Phycisphaerales bacterium]|nr:hypothetical protein [Phycisphaerales bacterium]